MRNYLFIIMLGLYTCFSHDLYGSGNLKNKNIKKSIEKKKRIKLASKELKEVLVVLKTNENLHASFFDYDAKKVETNAQALNKNISKISNKKISKLLKFSQKKLSLIKSSSPRASNDENYHLFSLALIYIVNNYEVGRYNAFSCPMVKKKWVQNSKTMKGVHNPYAPQMKRCGSKDSRY